MEKVLQAQTKSCLIFLTGGTLFGKKNCLQVEKSGKRMFAQKVKRKIIFKTVRFHMMYYMNLECMV